MVEPLVSTTETLRLGSFCGCDIYPDDLMILVTQQQYWIEQWGDDLWVAVSGHFLVVQIYPVKDWMPLVFDAGRGGALVINNKSRPHMKWCACLFTKSSFPWCSSSRSSSPRVSPTPLPPSSSAPVAARPTQRTPGPRNCHLQLGYWLAAMLDNYPNSTPSMCPIGLFNSSLRNPCALGVPKPPRGRMYIQHSTANVPTP